MNAFRRLTDLLSPRRVVVPLAAATWAEGIDALLSACVADGCVRDAARLAEVVREAWPADTMHLGPNAFLAHFRTDAVDEVVVALGVAPAPLMPARSAGASPRSRFAAASSEAAGARIMLLVVAPAAQAAEYLQTVAAFARALSRPEIVTGLHAASGPDAVLALPALRDVRLEGQLLVGDILPPESLAVAPDTPLDEAARLLLAHGVDAVPVVSSAREVLGLLSTRDLLRVLGPAYVQRMQTGETAGQRPGAAPARAVRDAMARTVLCVSEDQTVAEAATLLANKDVSGVPVVRDGALRGFLTRSDIVRRLLG
ncbi:MAG TPA: CBS domain-containing protein [Gemmatimonadales bacterium]|nr:CBS domain-containing protein [Gemmatimonadales bacterium]